MEANKKAQVIMLPTEDNTLISCVDGDITYHPEYHTENNQHLYFVSDEDIKEGDWCISMKDTTGIMTDEFMQQLAPFQANKNTIKLSEGFKRKIIATNDSKLNLPKPSKKFIEHYFDQAGINEVLVEYEERQQFQSQEDYDYHSHIQVKVTSDNEIIINSVKNNWTKDEILLSIEQAMIEGISLGEFRDKWIKENL